MHTHIHTGRHTCTGARARPRGETHVHRCVRTSTRGDTRAQVRAHVHTGRHTCIGACARPHGETHVHRCAHRGTLPQTVPHAHTQVHTNTHAQTFPPQVYTHPGTYTGTHTQVHTHTHSQNQLFLWLNSWDPDTPTSGAVFTPTPCRPPEAQRTRSQGHREPVDLTPEPPTPPILSDL